MRLVVGRLLVFESVRSMLLNPVVHDRQVLSHHRQPSLIIVLEVRSLRFLVVGGCRVHIWSLGVVDPGDSCLLEVSPQLLLLTALDDRLVPLAFHELGLQECAHLFGTKQFDPHIENYYKQTI